MVEHLHGMQGVSGSNPLTSTTKRDCHRSPSSRGLGHDPFTVGTGVRIPVGTPSLRSSRTVAFLLSAAWNGALSGRYKRKKRSLNPSFPSLISQSIYNTRFKKALVRSSLGFTKTSSGEPSSTMTPPSMKMTRSATSFANVISCPSWVLWLAAQMLRFAVCIGFLTRPSNTGWVKIGCIDAIGR